MKEKGKILVIEDNIRWQEKLRKYLTAAGYYVEVAETIEMALQKVVCDRFHFITIDMQLDNNNQSPLKYEGWKILEVVTKLRIQYTTPCMVITAHGEDYEELRHAKRVESLFLMEKSKFNKEEFLLIIDREVKRIDLRFKDDHRSN